MIIVGRLLGYEEGKSFPDDGALQSLIDSGKTMAEIAESVEKSGTSIRSMNPHFLNCFSEEFAIRNFKVIEPATNQPIDFFEGYLIDKTAYLSPGDIVALIYKDRFNI